MSHRDLDESIGFVLLAGNSCRRKRKVCARRRVRLRPSGGEPGRRSLPPAFLAGTMGQTQSGAKKEVCVQDIQELYRRFASECPSGNLHLHEFKRIFGINSSSSAEESAYMEIVFDSFDTNKVRKEENS